MNMLKLVKVAALVAVVLALAVFLAVVGLGVWAGRQPAASPIGNAIAPQPPLIGGQKDIHGCLGPAGYSWCEAKQKCLRVWEEYCTAAAPKTAVFICAGDQSVVATFYPTDDQSVDLVLPGDRRLTVPRALSASGARYAKPDESFVFWNKGDTAFITEDGTTTFDGCVTKE